ncbi:hypothetical protein EHS13_07160 [Paenibacillus psychroresistens]|uniref:SLH domain-containing protein n=1 Tax=Paenibacillus psychroresistens TaxID=1778678 RepID=A0A6B8RE04_9BACL|nr:S-layer homology domain-containing protein [Paenibacillus psychroresistens]QGQ94681.1 hypothetical protein EHS13_07160 [Paenibacillus psychroresistens]
MKKLLAIAVILSILTLSGLSAYADQTNVQLDDISGHWAEKYIKDLVGKNILEGDEQHHFNPDQHVTREQFAAMVARMYLLNNSSTTQNFVDVPQGRWSFNDVEATKDYFDAFKSLNGDYEFAPTKGVQRQDVAVTLVKVMMKMNSIQLMDAKAADQLLQGKFKDAGKIAVPLRPYLATAVQNKLIHGDDKGQYNPDQILTRAESAALLDRIGGVKIKQIKLGNVFSDNESASFTVETSESQLTWTATDFRGKQVASRTEAVTGTTAAIQLPRLGSGYYTFQVTALSGDDVMGSAKTSFAVLPKIDLTQTPSTPFGIATHFGQLWSPEMIPLLEQAGLKNIRDEMYWGVLEKAKNVYTYPANYDKYYNELKSRGMDAFVVLSYTNSLFDKGSTPYTDEGRQGFANYANAMLNHYSDVKWVEVYNEFNIGYGDQGNGPANSMPDYYYKLLKKTYQTVKASHPDKLIVGPVTSGIPLKWLEQLFQLGGLNYMDVVSVHPYSYPESPKMLERDLANLQELIKKYNNGKTKPIWISEIGWPTGDDSRMIEENVQANYAVISNVEALAAGVQKLIWYDFMNDGTDPHNVEHNFGIIRNVNDPMGKYAPKPAYVAYGTMTRQIADKPFLKKETIIDGINSYLFGSNSKATRVMWNESDKPKQVKIKTELPLTVTDIMGEQKILNPAQDGNVYLTVSNDPIYTCLCSTRLVL